MKLKYVHDLYKAIEKFLESNIKFEFKKNLIKNKLNLRQEIEKIQEINNSIMKQYKVKDEKNEIKYTKTETEMNIEFQEILNKESIEIELLTITFHEREMQNLDANILEKLIYYGIITDFE